MTDCMKMVSVWLNVGFHGKEHNITCGSSWNGRKVFCDPCEKKIQEQYPQGYDYYPGDRCKHGVYTGGCGIDYMCPRCEEE